MDAVDYLAKARYFQSKWEKKRHKNVSICTMLRPTPRADKALLPNTAGLKGGHVVFRFWRGTCRAYNAKQKGIQVGRPTKNWGERMVLGVDVYKN